MRGPDDHAEIRYSCISFNKVYYLLSTVLALQPVQPTATPSLPTLRSSANGLLACSTVGPYYHSTDGRDSVNPRHDIDNAQGRIDHRPGNEVAAEDECVEDRTRNGIAGLQRQIRTHHTQTSCDIQSMRTAIADASQMRPSGNAHASQMWRFGGVWVLGRISLASVMAVQPADGPRARGFGFAEPRGNSRCQRRVGRVSGHHAKPSAWAC